MSDRYQDESGRWHYRIFDREDGGFLSDMMSHGINMILVDGLIEDNMRFGAPAGLSDEQRTKLRNERSEALRAWDAGDFNLARALATASYMYSSAVRIAQDLEKHQSGLTDEGRHKGGETTKARAAAHRESIRKAVEGYLTHPLSSVWKDQQMCNDLFKQGLQTHGGRAIKEGQMKNYIKAIRKEFKARQSTS
jgi:hypothetical protein